MKLFLVALLTLLAGFVGALNRERFALDYTRIGWSEKVGKPDSASAIHFFLGLKLKMGHDTLQHHLLDVSTPRSPNYGKHWSLDKVMREVYASEDVKQGIAIWLRESLGASAEVDASGAFIKVKSTVVDVERAFGTELGVFHHAASGKSTLRALRSLSVTIPSHLEAHISFVSLNAPVMSIRTNALKSSTNSEASLATMKVSAGNKEAMASFQAFCSDGSLNVQSPPCKDDSSIPSFTAVATAYANNRSDPFSLEQDPLTIEIPSSSIGCFNSFTLKTCSGNDGNNCTCLAKVSPLPKYTQLKLQMFASKVKNSTVNIGNSSYFALTDVATPDMLSALYSIPKGLSVKHGSTQACAEFYGNQYFSNSDLASYLALSGLPANPILPENCYGSLPYNASVPAGGEAQLDVELLQGLAINAETSFYNYDESNPYSAENEGFLSWCNTVSQQASPPLVFSVSYGDLEQSVFNSSESGSWEYGMAVDQQLAIMGLRGISVLFSSGDDGLGSQLIRSSSTYATACKQAWPEWPASSPYVTAVGATMLTDKPIPLCGQPYYEPATLEPTLPPSKFLLAECTLPGETVCSSTFGGVISSGGGFSNVFNRQGAAPWQESAVSAYLQQSSKLPQGVGYFNTTGRAYPDVATYGSNFFVYLNGEVVRESGTSGSAPVMAAMVTLWNDMRLAYGLPPLGFINPFLYDVAARHPEAFQDVTTGNNACGAGGGLTTASCCSEYFSAAVGWDATTGLGSPNFRTIANLVINDASLFPASESVTPALPSAPPSAPPSLAPVAPPTSTDSSGSASPAGSYAASSTTGVAGVALAFSLINSLALIAGYRWYLTQGSARRQAGPLINDIDDKSSRGSGLYNPLRE